VAGKGVIPRGGGGGSSRVKKKKTHVLFEELQGKGWPRQIREVKGKVARRKEDSGERQGHLEKGLGQKGGGGKTGRPGKKKSFFPRSFPGQMKPTHRSKTLKKLLYSQQLGLKKEIPAGREKTSSSSFWARATHAHPPVEREPRGGTGISLGKKKKPWGVYGEERCEGAQQVNKNVPSWGEERDSVK